MQDDLRDAKIRVQNAAYMKSNEELRDILLQLVGQKIIGISVVRDKRGESILEFRTENMRFSLDLADNDTYVVLTRGSEFSEDGDEGYINSPNYNHLMGSRDTDDTVIVGVMR